MNNETTIKELEDALTAKRAGDLKKKLVTLQDNVLNELTSLTDDRDIFVAAINELKTDGRTFITFVDGLFKVAITQSGDQLSLDCAYPSNYVNNAIEV